MKINFLLFITMLVIAACNDNVGSAKDKGNENIQQAEAGNKAKHFEGVISNGFKGDKISFDISKDGKNLENLTFNGHWKCGSTLEQTTVGPDGAFEVEGNRVSGHITEPPGGGSTAWRFELEATIDGDEAEGTFRMNINNLGCDTYKLQWKASAK